MDRAQTGSTSFRCTSVCTKSKSPSFTAVRDNHCRTTLRNAQMYTKPFVHKKCVSSPPCCRKVSISSPLSVGGGGAVKLHFADENFKDIWASVRHPCWRAKETKYERENTHKQTFHGISSGILWGFCSCVFLFPTRKRADKNT